MKKSTKKTVAALAIVLIFGFSSIAFIGTNLFFGGGSTASAQQEFTPLDSFVINGEIDAFTESVYVQNGFTFLKFYYNKTDNIYFFVDSLPDIMTAPTGERQVIIEKIESPSPSATIINIQTFEEVENLTEEGIFVALCKNLIFTPTDCLLAGLGPESGQINLTA